MKADLQVARCNTLDFKILRRVAGELEDLRSQVLQDGSRINRRRCAHTPMSPCARLHVAMNTPHGKLNGSV